MVDLRAKPFYLGEEQVRWVNDTLASMTLEEKAGQVFCPMGFASDEETLRHIVCEISAGGMMYRPGIHRQNMRLNHKPSYPV